MAAHDNWHICPGRECGHQAPAPASALFMPRPFTEADIRALDIRPPLLTGYLDLSKIKDKEIRDQLGQAARAAALGQRVWIITHEDGEKLCGLVSVPQALYQDAIVGLLREGPGESYAADDGTLSPVVSGEDEMQLDSAEVAAWLKDARRDDDLRPDSRASIAARLPEGEARTLVAQWRESADALAASDPLQSSHFYDCAAELERRLETSRDGSPLPADED